MAAQGLRIALLSSLLAALAAPAAHAQGSDTTGIGLGVSSTLTGIAGPTLTYQASQFHVDGVLAFDSDNDAQDTELELAGRFFWAVHSSGAADFSIGGGLGFVTVDRDGNDNYTRVDVELAAKIRVFLAPNVALAGSLGVGVMTGDDDGVAFDGQLIGGFGLTYFFF